MKQIQEGFLSDRVKVLNREELFAYAKGKGHFPEDKELAKLPADDPRVKMTEPQKLAKACVDRLFEFEVHARRSKKEKI